MISIIALLLSIINIYLSYRPYKLYTSLLSRTNDLNKSMDNTTDWISYYKKDVEKKVNYLVKTLNKKFNKNV